MFLTLIIFSISLLNCSESLTIRNIILFPSRRLEPIEVSVLRDPEKMNKKYFSVNEILEKYAEELNKYDPYLNNPLSKKNLTLVIEGKGYVDSEPSAIVPTEVSYKNTLYLIIKQREDQN